MVESSAGRETRTTLLVGRHKCRCSAREQQRCCRSSHWPHGLLSFGRMYWNDGRSAAQATPLTPTSSFSHRGGRGSDLGVVTEPKSFILQVKSPNVRKVFYTLNVNAMLEDVTCSSSSIDICSPIPQLVCFIFIYFV